MSLKKPKILLILATFINVGCSAFMIACPASMHIDVYGFDLNHSRLYYGKKDNPTDTVGLNDPALDEQWIAMKVTSWNAVKSYCGSVN